MLAPCKRIGIKKISLNKQMCTQKIQTWTLKHNLQLLYSSSQTFRLFVQTKAYKKSVLIKHCLTLLCLAQNQHPGKSIIWYHAKGHVTSSQQINDPAVMRRGVFHTSSGCFSILMNIHPNKENTVSKQNLTDWWKKEDAVNTPVFLLQMLIKLGLVIHWTQSSCKLLMLPGVGLSYSVGPKGE